MEILELFGVDWKLMAAQLVNFAIVVFVLWKFAIKPLMATMEERNKEISKGLDDAKSATERLDQVEKEVKDKLNQVKQEGAVVLDKARKQSTTERQTTIDKTKEEVASVIAQAKEQIASEKTAMVAEVKSEVADMVVVALQKILSEKLSKDLDQKYIDQVLKDLK